MARTLRVIDTPICQIAYILSTEGTGWAIICYDLGNWRAILADLAKVQASI